MMGSASIEKVGAGVGQVDGSSSGQRPPPPSPQPISAAAVATRALQVVDASRGPVDAVIPLMNGVSPYMPDHQHGTSIAPVATGQGSGGYQVTPLYLYMSGYWEITLDMLAPPAADASAFG